jgi:Asp-tRNA(Asn)/Glu-tRNA(Gln) amidotransferase A subunit family amidase
MAEEQAAEADRLRAAGGSGALLGIPVAVKDNIDVAGLPTSSGCRALAGAMPLRSATVVERLRAAGAVIVGKTNLSEFSFEIRSRSSLGGDVLHPLAPHATAGGSSGGSAVALARGYALGALGTDTGGSIRIPAAYNGLVGFRPAHGSLPMDGIAPLAPSTDTVGPLALSVADLRLMLAALDLPVPEAPRPLQRLGVIRELFGTHPGVSAVSEGAIQQLASAGVVLVDIPPLPEAFRPDLGDHIVDAEFAPAFDSYLSANFMPGTAPGSLAELFATGDWLPDHEAALKARMAAAGRETGTILARHRALADHLEQVRGAFRLDGFVYPTSQVVPDSLGNPPGGWAPELAARSGWPAVTVCAGVTDAAMPVGLEFLAPPGSEALLLACAEQVERARA